MTLPKPLETVRTEHRLAEPNKSAKKRSGRLTMPKIAGKSAANSSIANPSATRPSAPRLASLPRPIVENAPIVSLPFPGRARLTRGRLNSLEWERRQGDGSYLRLTLRGDLFSLRQEWIVERPGGADGSTTRGLARQISAVRRLRIGDSTMLLRSLEAAKLRDKPGVYNAARVENLSIGWRDENGVAQGVDLFIEGPKPDGAAPPPGYEVLVKTLKKTARRYFPSVHKTAMWSE